MAWNILDFEDDDFRDGYHYTSKEYDALAIEMQKMSNSELGELFEYACYCHNNYTGAYGLSDKLGILAERHQMHIDISRAIDGDKSVSEKDYARAILVKCIADRMRELSGLEHNFVPKLKKGDS